MWFLLRKCPLFDEAGGDAGAGGGGGASGSSSSSSSSTPSTSTPPSATPSSGSSVTLDSLESMLLGDDTGDENDSADGSTAASAEESADATGDEPASDAGDQADTEETSGESDSSTDDGDDWDPEVGKPTVVKDAKGKEVYQWPKNRGQRIYEGYKVSKQYQEIAPTVEEARTHQETFIGHQKMLSDWQAGSPENLDNFFGYLNTTSPQTMERAVEFLADPNVLGKGNPAAYQKLQSSVLHQVGQNFYEDARQLLASDPNSEDGQKALFMAQSIDYVLNRDPRDLAQIQAPPPAPDAREQDLAAREARIREAETSQQRSVRDQWVSTVNKDLTQGFTDQVGKALAPLKALKESNPKMYGRAVSELRNEVAKGIQSDKAFQDLWKMESDRAAKSRDESAKTALQQRYLQRTRVEISKRIAPIIKDYSQLFVNANAAQHDKLAKSGARKEVTGGTGANGSKGMSVVDSKYAAAKTVDDKIGALLGL